MTTPQRGRPKGQQASKLSSEKIIICAAELLQQQGKVPSLRQVSRALEVDPMALYHYFDNKAALLQALCLQLFTQLYQPSGRDFRLQIQRLCHSYLQLLSDYPGLLETVLSMADSGPAQVFCQRFEQALAPLNLSAAQQEAARDLLVDYLHGFALSMQCNRSGQPLTVAHSSAAINLYLDGLSAPNR
ncbi:TetR/AcrR family transcriptional regulator [uncultured Ferrimonas sp.]|uniref:TetR/AcrR family transcriptional regulator n=1 Tax=uncultured Ferrimonas sp. TaxID=432640 RepID=UPI002617E9E2|nr:TetR/AcrR family transcriptional regulator [uncultured Ferrimonas sp.]